METLVNDTKNKDQNELSIDDLIKKLSSNNSNKLQIILTKNLIACLK